MSILNKLTEGIVNRDMRKEGAALLDKWERTGLLEGLQDESLPKMVWLVYLKTKRKSFFVKLLRQCRVVMLKALQPSHSHCSSCFGGLIANDLVSVQPMSLPSGLIFFMDFTFGGTTGDTQRLGFDDGDSLYGGGVVGSQMTGGVDLDWC